MTDSELMEYAVEKTRIFMTDLADKIGEECAKYVVFCSVGSLILEDNGTKDFSKYVKQIKKTTRLFKSSHT